MTAQFREKIGPLEGTCEGLRCWIVGAGPSLDDVPIAALRGKYIMALNAAVLKFTNVRAFPDAWWVWCDSRTLRELWDKVRKTWKRTQCLIHKKGMEDMRSHQGAGRYIEYVKEEFKATRTVAETAILLAQFLGFSEIVLVGIDGMQARDGKAYADEFNEWKQCHFMKNGTQESCQRSSDQMVEAMEALKKRMGDRGDIPRIIQTSELYPARSQFEFMPFAEAVKLDDRPTKKPTRAHAKF